MAESQPSWEIMIAKQPEKTLRRLPHDTFQEINRAILALAQNPHPPESRQLAGHENLYRLRLDPDGWRIVYAVEEERLIILILEIAPRQQPERYQADDELLGQIQRYQVDHELPRRIRGETIRVKIVADNPELRKNLLETLTDESDIEIVSENTKADIMLMEWKMSREVMPQDTSTREVTIVAVDGFDLIAGVRDFVTVPFSRDELLSTIHRVYSLRAGETTMKTATHLLKFYNLGMYAEISLSVVNLSESMAFYEKLGLKKVEEGQDPHPWAVLSDERLLIGLYQKSFPSPMLNYFNWGEISTRVDFLKTLNITFDHMQTLGVPITPRQDNFVIAAEFEAFEGQRVRLTHLWSEKINPGRNFFARCDKFGELSLKTTDVDAAVTYWKQLGFHRIAGDDRPYPWATLTDGAIRLGLHQTSKFSKPTISYFAPDMPDRLKQLQKAGLKFLSEHKDAQGQRIGAVVQSPDGQPFFLFTGQVASRGTALCLPHLGRPQGSPLREPILFSEESDSPTGTTANE